jgi:hypothetical protein
MGILLVLISQVCLYVSQRVFGPEPNQWCSQFEHKECLFSTCHTAAVRKNWLFQNEFDTYIGTM